MSQLYVRGNQKQVFHGTVVSMGSSKGIVTLDHNVGRICFDMKDGCNVGLGESDFDKALKFTSAVDIVMPIPHGPEISDEYCRIVLVKDEPSAWLWAFECDYFKAVDALTAFLDAELEKAEERQRRYDRELHEREQVEIKKNKAREAIKALGLFRIAKAHKFDQETERRPSKPATGPTELFSLLTQIRTGRIEFEPSTPKGSNDTLFMWFEQQTHTGWQQVEISNDDMLDILSLYEGEEIGWECIQSIIDRLSAPNQEVVPA